jgi:hypothetical protein
MILGWMADPDQAGDRVASLYFTDMKTWVQQQVISYDIPFQNLGFQTGVNDDFGSNVVVSFDGRMMAVSASGASGNSDGDDAGRVYVFSRGSMLDLWGSPPSSPFRGRSKQFIGYTLAMSGDGLTIASGERSGDFIAASGQIFGRIVTVWRYSSPTVTWVASEVTVDEGSTPVPGTGMGYQAFEVTLSFNGGVLLAHSWRENIIKLYTWNAATSRYVYRIATPVITPTMTSMDIDPTGTLIIVGLPSAGNGQGGFTLLKWKDPSWEQLPALQSQVSPAYDATYTGLGSFVKFADYKLGSPRIKAIATRATSTDSTKYIEAWEYTFATNQWAKSAIQPYVTMNGPTTNPPEINYFTR